MMETFICDLYVSLINLSTLDWLDNMQVNSYSLLKGLILLMGSLYSGLCSDLNVLLSFDFNNLFPDYIVIFNNLSVYSHMSMLNDLLVDWSLDLILNLNEHLSLNWDSLFNNL